MKTTTRESAEAVAWCQEGEQERRRLNIDFKTTRYGTGQDRRLCGHSNKLVQTDNYIYYYYYIDLPYLGLFDKATGNVGLNVFYNDLRCIKRSQVFLNDNCRQKEQ